MAAPVTTDLVWREIEKSMFAVLGMITPRGEPLTAGIVYVVENRKIYISTGGDSAKAASIRANPHVALTITSPRGIPFMPWIKIPPATVNLKGTATLFKLKDAPAEVNRKLSHGLTLDPETEARLVVICVEPRGEFVTYGVGVSLATMRKVDEARGRAPVS